MKARILLLVVWYGIAFAIIGTAAAKAATTPDRPDAKLTKIAARYAGNVRVVVHQFGCPGPVRSCTDMTAGEEYTFEDGSKLIQLAPDVARALHTRRVIEPEYPRSNTGQAVFTFAHEIGHGTGTKVGTWEEARADCYAAKHWRQVARALGFTSAQLPALARQIDGGIGAGKCWGPYAGSDL